MPNPVTALKRTHRSEEEIEDSTPLLPNKLKKTGCIPLHPTVKKASCTSSFTKHTSSIKAGGPYYVSPVIDPSVVLTVSSTYRTQFSTAPNVDVHIKVEWSQNNKAPIVSIHKSFWTQRRWNHDDDSVIDIYWDVSSAKYGSGGPEPTKGFFVAVVHRDSAFLLGDISSRFVEEFKGVIKAVDFSIIQREEEISGGEFYSTKAPLTDGGAYHDILIRQREGTMNRGAEMSVWVDKRVVAHVKNVEYNFKGNVKLSVDGSPIMLMWDLLGWCSVGRRKAAWFLFQTMSSPESELWVEEEISSSACLFSLMIDASTAPLTGTGTGSGSTSVSM